jgi:IS5 family transposase
VVKTGKVRADTTVVSANVDYPTDTGLLARAVSRMSRLVRRIRAVGAAPRTPFQDRTRAAGRRVRSIAAHLRLRSAQAREQAQATITRITRQLTDLARHTSTEAQAVLHNARRAVARMTGQARGRLRRAVNELAIVIQRTDTVIAQARIRMAGGKPDSATRLVSLHDPDARPIVKGRLGKPIEFGYKAQIVDNVDGIVLDHTVEEGNPPDAPQLAPAIERISQRTGQPPRAVAADRGYGEASVETDLHDAGVKTVAIPRKGRPGTARQAHERQPGFRRLVKWRTGCEGRISHLKHRYDLARTRLDGLTGARTWCGYAVLAHNLTKITALAATQA